MSPKACFNCGKPFGFLSSTQPISNDESILLCDNCYRQFGVEMNILKIYSTDNSASIEICESKYAELKSKVDIADIKDSTKEEVLRFANDLLEKKRLMEQQKENENIVSQEDAIAEKAKKEAERINKIASIIVTTGDLKQDYDVIGPVYFQVSNKGIFGSSLSKLIFKYSSQIQQMKSTGQLSQERADWGFLYGEWSVGQNDFDKAFYVATQELKERAAMLGADAIVCMRQDIDLDTNGFAYFYLQMYGTAVRFK